MQRELSTNWNLGEEWAAWHADHPESDLREDAHVLGVSEAELLATGCGESVTRLQGGWIELLRGLQELGPVTVQTQSDGSIIEARGIAVPAEWSGRRGVLRVGASRVRIQLDQWYFGYAVQAAGRESLQFFDAAGRSILKIRLEPESMADRWTQLVRRFTAADQNPWEPTVRAATPATTLADAAVDVAALHAAWDALQSPQDFTAMLRRLGISRAQAARLAGTSRARAVSPGSFASMLRTAASAMLPLALSIETPGVTHTYAGMVRRVEDRDDLLMVVEPGLRLYVSEAHVAAAWVVRRPTPQGPISSLQYFDAQDNLILMVCGNAQPGEAGVERWERLLASA